MFTLIALVLFVLAVVLFVWGFTMVANNDWKLASIIFIVGFLLGIGGFWMQTHYVVATQKVGVTRNSITQEIKGVYPSGIISKPFFGQVYSYPSSSAFERCEQYTPAIKGSYGIVLDLCFYFDTGNVDWVSEINKTGLLNADLIMGIWRNNVVRDVAKSVRSYTPEALSENSSEVENEIFKNVFPWFESRGIPLARVSFKNWDFSSEEVAKGFDESIVSQRKITEQKALFEASKISRERELYEAETAKLVASTQKESLDLLGLDGDAAVQYLWIKVLAEGGKVPDVLVLGTSNVPVSVTP